MKVLWVSGEQQEQSRAKQRAWRGGTGLAGKLSQDFGQTWTEWIFFPRQRRAQTDKLAGTEVLDGADIVSGGDKLMKSRGAWGKSSGECVCALCVRVCDSLCCHRMQIKPPHFHDLILRRITKATKKESLYHRTMLRGLELFCLATSVTSQSKQNNKTVSLFNRLIQSSVLLLNHLLFIVH